MDSLVPMPQAATGDFASDAALFSGYWRQVDERLRKLPPKAQRDTAAHEIAEIIKQAARDARFLFLRRHARTLYDRLTDSRRKFVRIERLVYDAAELVPGLVPTRAEVAAEADLRQADKEGREIDQGILCNQLLADTEAGLHLCHAMLLPREESPEALAKFLRDGSLDLGGARVERHGKAAVLLLSNKRFLNSEDNYTQVATEIGADVCILDPQSKVAVLRGDVVPEGKYAGRRVFNAGINLTHLYYGKIPFLWFLVRDMGFVNKMTRGLARADVAPDERGLEDDGVLAADEPRSLDPCVERDAVHPVEHPPDGLGTGPALAGGHVGERGVGGEDRGIVVALGVAANRVQVPCDDVVHR